MFTKHYIQPNWPAPSNVKAYTSTRQNGFSKPPFSSFNLATHVGDEIQAVAKNRIKLHHDLLLPSNPHWLCQEHATQVIALSCNVCGNIKSDKNLYHGGVSDGLVTPLADASYTSDSNTICAILTADCLPILLCNRRGTVVAAIHAGWRGLAAGIIEKTISTISYDHTDNKDLLVWLGPAIGPTAFVVGVNVFETFVAHNSQARTAFQKITNTKDDSSNKWLANIYLLAKQRLIACDISENQIYGADFCTYSDEDLFFSYRRDQINHGSTGRMASLIWLQKK